MYRRCCTLRVYDRTVKTLSLCLKIWVILSICYLLLKSTCTSSEKSITSSVQLQTAPYSAVRSTFKTKNILPKVQVIYNDISHCPKRPQYFPQYKAQCWGECKVTSSCSQPVSLSDIEKKRADLRCLGNMNFVGIRKSGTSDIKWRLLKNMKIVLNEGDYRITRNECPVNYFNKYSAGDLFDAKRKYSIDLRPEKLENGYLQYAPGNLLISSKIARNSTHLVITSAMQYLGFMSTPDTKFYVQIRNPTDRTISYLFHWHNRQGDLFPNMTLEQMDAKFVDQVIKQYVLKLQKCLAEQGELYCAYLSDGKDGDLNCLIQHSMYVVYIKEAFKFIPKEQFMFVTSSEYSADMMGIGKALLEDFFHLPFNENTVDMKKERANVGLKNPVWNSTIKLLDQFYGPYNRRLAQLLGDDKWLFAAERKT